MLPYNWIQRSTYPVTERAGDIKAPTGKVEKELERNDGFFEKEDTRICRCKVFLILGWFYLIYLTSNCLHTDWGVVEYNMV